MTTNVTLQPAFVLHARAYRDTSFLVDFFTKEYGRVTSVARGARSIKSNLQGLITPFLPLLISFGGRGDLYSLKQAEIDGMNYDLRAKDLLSGIYLNELLFRLLPKEEAYPKVYEAYQKTLSDLVKTIDPEVELRLFEKNLLVGLGYGLELGHTVCGDPILSDQSYFFVFGKGFSLVTKKKRLDGFSGKSLLALKKGVFESKEELRDAKKLMRLVFMALLGNKPLKTRELFMGMV